MSLWSTELASGVMNVLRSCPFLGKIDVRHLYCCLPMAIWHSFLLVGHYRIFRSMNTLTNYHSLDPKDEMELLMTSEIGSLKYYNMQMSQQASEVMYHNIYIYIITKN